MNDTRLLACVVVLLLLVAFIGSPAISSACTFLPSETTGEVDIDCMKGGEGSAGDDDAWAGAGDDPPADTQEKVSGTGPQSKEVCLTDSTPAVALLSGGILFRILFARLFVL